MPSRFVQQYRLLSVVLFFFGLVSGCSDDRSPSSSSPDPGTAPLAIVAPVRMVEGDNSLLLVSDYEGQAVLKWSMADQSLSGKIDIPGHPTGLARVGNEIIVGNESRGNVEVYDLNTGYYLRKMSSVNKLFTLPNGIAVDQSLGIVFVVDTRAGLVRQFNLDGTSAGPDLGTGATELKNPTAIEVDEVNQFLYVSDYGEPVSSFGDTPAIHAIYYGSAAISNTRIEGATFDFDRPQGLALHNGKLFVAESVAGKVLVFDVANLSAVTQLPAVGAGSLRMPLDVYIDPATNDLYVISSLDADIVVIPGGGA